LRTEAVDDRKGEEARKIAGGKSATREKWAIFFCGAKRHLGLRSSLAPSSRRTHAFAALVGLRAVDYLIV